MKTGSENENWKVLASEYLIRKPWLTARVDRLELPCGVIEKGESPLEAAKRELAEETGYGGGEWRELMQISPNPGAMTNMTHCFVATGVEKVFEQHFDEHECLTVHLLDCDEVFRLMKDGEIFQSLMLAPLWRYFSGKEKK
jgi:8-oxo-dGTP pyrophosphatase MutT (NUDIX family)